MMKNNIQLVLGMAFAAALLSACGLMPESNAGGSTEILADYPAFNRDELFSTAELIVEATVLSAIDTVLMPMDQGDNELGNPLFGLDPIEKKRAQEEALDTGKGIPATALTLRVDAIHKGKTQVGKEIVIVQTGVAHSNNTFVSSNETPLQIDRNYLLFGVESTDGSYYILGGDAGSYIAQGSDEYVAVNPGMAPFSKISREQVESRTQ